MDHSDGVVNDREFGKLVLHSMPSKETEEMVVSYLSRMVKNVPAEKLARRIKKTPFVLSNKIAVKKGERIAQNLRDLGAKADFVPQESGAAQGPERLAGDALTPEFESIQLISEQHESEQSHRPGPSRSGKHLVTAIVAVILIAVFSFMGWQLYLLLTEKFVN